VAETLNQKAFDPPAGFARAGAEDGRITWVEGDERPGPRQVIGVLEVQADGSSRAVFAERTQVDGRCHVLLARQAWGGKDSLDARRWSIVLDRKSHKVHTIRNGSCGDPLLTQDVPRIVAALEEMDLIAEQTMIAVDDGRSVFPRLRRPASAGSAGS
jgi:hypothetical protein